MASDTDEALGWAGGAEQAAAKAELARLKKFGEALRDLTTAAQRIEDPEARAALQDRNLEAFERMTAEVGLLSLERMRDLLGALAEAGVAAEPGAAAAAEARIAATQEEIDAARDRESAALMRQLRESYRRAAEAAGKAVEAFEPFDGGPDAPVGQRES
ncbi:MAG: hypothetical protein AAGM38_10370 [Pseudomonadota bacterium]